MIMSSQADCSVIIPVKNGQKYILNAIRSVTTQTTPPALILVVDNDSTDNTVPLIQQSNLSVTIIHENKPGAAAARNKGLKSVKSPFVAFLDSDDICHPGRLQKSLQVLEANPEAAMAFCAIEYTDDSGIPTGTTITCPEYRAMDFFAQLLIRNRIPTTSCAVMRTEILKSTGGFDENLSHNEEYDLWLRIAERHKIAYIDQILTYYRLHGENISMDKEGQQKNERLALMKHDLDTIRIAIQNLYRDPLEAEIAYARILFRRGNLQLSKNLIFKLSRSEHQHYLLQFYLGNFQMMDGKPALAANAYHNCLKLQPDFLPALNNLGIVQWGQGHSELARSNFNLAIEKNNVYQDPKTNLEKMDRNMDYQELNATWAPLRKVLKPMN